ncbi:BlaI/MecI/CopY family transcriptional regulator [Aureliella helgolandensis]|uniref:Penicillinase repressor n=1 Tax=Aureliella helgolandensis TaxID=2527968 RepID=A0A518G4V1_9BACT|nr:BlaI/MecI/CopY family transcriptional regulator [Aureliella helgolandensis]QDV23623.1 Penicillinase repressor [Aureliella helgolandensis]
MARPTSKELTQRELEVMHVFWKRGDCTATEVRDALAATGVDRVYVTVANLVRILVDKGYVEPVNSERPFRYRPVRSFNDISSSLVTDLLKRVYGGSRELLLVQLLGQTQKLTKKEREFLTQILEDQSNE